jgi:tetratricopeptide (TPR) repeat protein
LPEKSIASPQVKGNRAPKRSERVLVVGFGSLDPAEVERLMTGGRMPNLARIRSDGAFGTLQAGEPLSGPTLWTTAATGRHPENHNVLVPFSPRPDGGGVESTGEAAWKTPAFWRVAEAAGRRVITVAWPFAAPATAWPGTHVDANFSVATGPDFDSWALPPRCISPATLRSRLRETRLHPADVTGAMLAPFVPSLASVDQYRESRQVELAVILANASTVHAAATSLIESEPWDLAVAQYDFLEQVQRHFAGTRGHAVWGGVIDAAYQFADAMLGRLISLAGDDATIFVLSPNGVRNTAPGAPWRSHGLLAARGRWIAPGLALPLTRLVDIAPTVLARFGLVIPSDGQISRPLAPGQSRRRVTLPARSVPPEPRHVDALRALGYDDALTPQQVAALELAEGARQAALGEALLDRGRVLEAQSMLVSARRLLPVDSTIGLQRLALCYLLRGDAMQCRAIGETLLRILPSHGWGNLAIAAGFALEGDAMEASHHMADALEKGRKDPDLLVRLGGIALMVKRGGKATEYFNRALFLEPGMPAAEHGLAMARALPAAEAEAY